MTRPQATNEPPGSPVSVGTSIPADLTPMPDVQATLRQSDWIWERGSVRTEILHGNGDMVERAHMIEGAWDSLEIVNHINVQGGFTGFVFSNGIIRPENINIHLSLGQSNTITYRIDANLADFIDIRQDGTRLLISPREGYFLQSSASIDFYISVTDLSQLTLVGYVDVVGEIETEEFTFNSLGVIGASLDITAERVGIATSGARTNIDLYLNSQNVSVNTWDGIVLRGQVTNLLAQSFRLRDIDMQDLAVENFSFIEN